MRSAVLILSLTLGACATTKSSQRLPSQPQIVDAAFCRKLMADHTALVARTVQVNPAAPPDPAVDASWRRAQRMCADLVKDAPTY